MHFRTSNICAKKLNVQETDISLTHTAQQKLKLFLRMQVYAWTEFPRLIFGTWPLKYFIPNLTKSTNPKVRSHRETCRGTAHST